MMYGAELHVAALQRRPYRATVRTCCAVKAPRHLANQAVNLTDGVRRLVVAP